MSKIEPACIPDGRVDVNGKAHMLNTKGGLEPISLIKPQHLLEDETVRKICGFGIGLSEQIARFKEHTFADISAFEAVLGQEYGVTIGGQKGNKTLMTYDGLYKVVVAVADRIDFGPELQVAKDLIDECLNEWAADSRDEIRTIVTRAFNTDKSGQINRSEIFMLLRLEIMDKRWKCAMAAIRDAMRVVGTKTYVRAYQRPSHDAGWQAIPLDAAKV